MLSWAGSTSSSLFPVLDVFCRRSRTKTNSLDACFYPRFWPGADMRTREGPSQRPEAKQSSLHQRLAFPKGKNSFPYTPQGSHRHQGPLPLSECKDFFDNRLLGLGSLIQSGETELTAVVAPPERTALSREWSPADHLQWTSGIQVSHGLVGWHSGFVYPPGSICV